MLKHVHFADLLGIGFRGVPRHCQGQPRICECRTFAQMVPSAYFINLSRGNLVDEAALAGVLDEKRISGAALDVGRARDQMPSLLARRAT